MPISAADKSLLRRLAAEVAEIAALPVHRQTIAEWKRHNGLQPGRPLVWVFALFLPWNELDYNDELKLRTTGEFAQGLETELRRILYHWRHMPGDMVVENCVYCPLVIRDTGYGIEEEVDLVRTDATSDVVSRDFHPLIRSEKDLERIKFRQITFDAEATEHNFAEMSEVFAGILPVIKRGDYWGGSIGPWDELIRWWGVTEAMQDLILRPELVHAAMDRMMRTAYDRLDQLEALNLLALDNNNVRCGTGGIGYTDDLPAPGFNPEHVRPLDMWGSSAAQIFSEVSPAMHEEFALRYERPWMERFGLSYYGCCEPLHHKIGMLRSVRNLRKISMSPWADFARGAEEIGRDYVFSYKPNPAIVAERGWRPELARKFIREALEQARGCIVEILPKDISTVCYQPQRLWEWTRIAMEEAENFA
jgi:hypothetical protein